MQTQNKSWWLLGLIVIIFFAGMYLGKKQSDSAEVIIAQESPDSTITQSEQAEESGQEADGEGVESSESNEGGKNAYRIKGNPAQARTPRSAANDAPRLDTDWEDEYQARTTLESALAGDEHDAIAVGELVMQCRGGYETEEQTEDSINRVAQSAQTGNPIPSLVIPGTGESLQFTNISEYENFIWTRFAQCDATRGMFGRQLRARLQELAEGGSPTARFLYAMWVPVQDSIDAERLADWVTYQSLAWDFTWQNIREGEPLGLLAYGRSLEQSGSIYFTPRHYNYAPAFIIASQKCGLDNKVINQKVGNMTSNWSQRNMNSHLNRAQSLSDEIVNMFCR